MMKIKSGKLWLCGQHVGKSWEFQGVFSTRQKAIDACKTLNYFIAPIFLNEELPKEPVTFKDYEYPLVDLIGLNFTEIEFIPVKEE